VAEEGLDPADYHAARVEFVYNELAGGREPTPQELAALNVPAEQRVN
jgi:hypothetical protein